MKSITILVFEIFLVSLMLIKPILVCNYFFKDSNVVVVLELAESEEDKSEKTSLELCDEIFHSIDFQWASNLKLVVSKKSHGVEIDKDGHIREIVPPPPQA